MLMGYQLKHVNGLGSRAISRVVKDANRGHMVWRENEEGDESIMSM